MPKEGNTEEEIPVESISKLFETPLITRKQTPILAHGIIFHKQDVHVFSTGTMQWSWALDDYGVKEGLRSSRLSNAIETMTWNFLKACGISQNGEDFSIMTKIPSQQKGRNKPAEGWIYEPKNLGYFWKKMGDRPFLRELYSHVGKYNHVIDVGARGYNRYCKTELINSTTTTYYQIEPFPPSLDEINNDGLLDCYMQEVPDKYPELGNSFDLVLDFGVFGWKAVLDTLTDSDKENYVKAAFFLLNDNGIWILKIDVGFVSKQDEFFRKYILPYFSLGDFEGYKSGHTIKQGKWRFYFLHKKVPQRK